jgi:hypothetical protein
MRPSSGWGVPASGIEGDAKSEASAAEASLPGFDNPMPLKTLNEHDCRHSRDGKH